MDPTHSPQTDPPLNDPARLSPAGASGPPVAEPRELPAGAAPVGGRAGVLLGALVIVVAVLIAGSRGLDAPWIQGDEHIFIVNNPDVSGSGPTQPTGIRWIDIFFHTHEDLYQPITILSYAIEWRLWGADRVARMRLTDVLIHAVNALLLWAVLAALFRRLAPQWAAGRTALAWSLALLWALHPMLVIAYTADMGRTHLLAATFLLLALLAHLRALQASKNSGAWFVLATLALLAAMLNKPMVGWVIVIAALEGLLVGWREMWRSYRIYVVGAICAAFALLTLSTTRESLQLEQDPLPLFGDPLARAALGLAIYLRNALLPGPWLCAWYPPDIHTGWGYWPVWAGVGLTLAAGVVAWRTISSRRWRGAAFGLIWCWAMWLPVSGLVGARVLAAQDRYFYQPLIGLLVALGVVLLRWTSGKPVRHWRTVAAAGGLGALALLAVPYDRQLAWESRSTLRRALRVVRQHPEDPRVREYLAAAYDFSHNHDTPEARQDRPPNFVAEMLKAYRQAAELAERHPEYFADDHNRAAFHRRLSYAFWRAGAYEDSLQQAQRAYDFEPDAPLTWLRLAAAYRKLGRWEDARRAYEKLEQLTPPDAPERPLRLVEYGDLLLRHFDDARGALQRFRAALLSDKLPPQALTVAMLGAARCEVLVGSGRDGFNLAMTVLSNDPENFEAGRIVALYHLRSHHWETAVRVYAALLERVPTDYESLRGLYNASAQLGRWDETLAAWRRAVQAAPDDRVLRSWLTWVAACAAADDTPALIEQTLGRWPDDRFAALAAMLQAARAGQWTEALEWIERAATGEALPLGRELVRAEALLRLLVERDTLPPGAAVLRAALLRHLQRAGEAQALLEEFLKRHPSSPAAGLATQLLRQPASRPAP